MLLGVICGTQHVGDLIYICVCVYGGKCRCSSVEM